MVLYIQRISYIENMVLLAVTAAFLLYQRAMDAPGWQRFAVAGVVLGAAGCLKYTGLYAVVAMGLCWLIQRRQHAGHAVLLATVVAVIAVDQVVLHCLVRAFLYPTDFPAGSAGARPSAVRRVAYLS